MDKVIFTQILLGKCPAGCQLAVDFGSSRPQKFSASWQPAGRRAPRFSLFQEGSSENAPQPVQGSVYRSHPIHCFETFLIA
jgi:hypothetical protein